MTLHSPKSGSDTLPFPLPVVVKLVTDNPCTFLRTKADNKSETSGFPRTQSRAVPIFRKNAPGGSVRKNKQQVTYKKGTWNRLLVKMMSVYERHKWRTLRALQRCTRPQRKRNYLKNPSGSVPSAPSCVPGKGLDSSAHHPISLMAQYVMTRCAV